MPVPGLQPGCGLQVGAAGPPGEASCLDGDVAEGKVEEAADGDEKAPEMLRTQICACAPFPLGKLWVPSREPPSETAHSAPPWPGHLRSTGGPCLSLWRLPV